MRNDLLTERAQEQTPNLVVVMNIIGLVEIAVALERHVGTLDAFAITFAFWMLYRALRRS